MKKQIAHIVSVVLLATLSLTASAMPPDQIKQILNMTKGSWVSFRDFNGKQLIYFTHLESYACGIKTVHYSINSDVLDRVWELQPCDPQNPNAVTKDIIYLTLPLGTAKSIAVKVTFADGSDSEIVHKMP
jgi:hypothetical protein